MPNNYDIAFTHSHRLHSDGSVTFECSQDREKWPWLELHPFHPIVVQTINFWASVETGITRGTFDPEKWSALTYIKWETGTPDVGTVVRGVADSPPEANDSDRPQFRITFYDDADRIVCRNIGEGVIFKTRDFEAWRDITKSKAIGSENTDTLNYAPASSLGVSLDVERFVSPLEGNTLQAARALITKQNGFMPQHPYHAGSGDHVNANHLGDAAFQFAHLVAGKPLLCTGGEMTFRNYVELGKIFTLETTQKTDNALSMSVQQNGKTCTDIKLNYSTLSE